MEEKTTCKKNNQHIARSYALIKMNVELWLEIHSKRNISRIMKRYVWMHVYP